MSEEINSPVNNASSVASMIESLINQPIIQREPEPSPLENVIDPPVEPARYDFTKSEFQVSLSLKLNPEKSITVVHNLRRPAIGELIERENQSIAEVEEVFSGEDTYHNDNDQANSRLWDKCALSVSGYRVGGKLASETVTVSPEIAAKIPMAHKSTAISGLYAAKCEVERAEDEGFNLDGDTYTIRQEIGASETPDFVIRHELRQPTESELRDYNRRASTATQVTGSRKRKIRVRTNLKADVELYDKLAVSIAGCTPPDPRACDPIFKRQVVQTLLSSLTASLSD